jgi:hypothetical protein
MRPHKGFQLLKDCMGFWVKSWSRTSWSFTYTIANQNIHDQLAHDKIKWTFLISRQYTGNLHTHWARFTSAHPPLSITLSGVVSSLAAPKSAHESQTRKKSINYSILPIWLTRISFFLSFHLFPFFFSLLHFNFKLTHSRFDMGHVLVTPVKPEFLADSQRFCYQWRKVCGRKRKNKQTFFCWEWC